MLKIYSRRWIDLTRYKSKDILLSIVMQRVPNVQPANKSKSMYRCLCPFHREKTPSFTLYFNKYYAGWGYKCFGCGTSGDVFRFLMCFERWEFWDAMLHVTKNHIPGCVWPPTSPNLLQFEIPFPKEKNREHPDNLPF